MRINTNKFMAIISGLLLVCTARADSYLYWMMDEVTDPKLEFAYARIASCDGAGNVNYLGIMASGSGKSAQSVDSDWEARGADNDLGTKLIGVYYSLMPDNFQGMTFFVELYNWNDSVVGVSEYATYDDIRTMVYSDKELTGITPYSFSASVPEPSCGLLVLFGLGLLGLKRRERKFEV